MDCSLPGSSIHGIFQARVLEWVAIAFSKKNIYFCFIDYAKAFDYMDHNKLWKILQETGIPGYLGLNGSFSQTTLAQKDKFHPLHVSEYMEEVNDQIIHGTCSSLPCYQQ